MAEHSPTPWRTEVTSIDPMGLYVADQVGNLITAVPIDAANADYIVRCVNNFKALVEACRYARAILPPEGPTYQMLDAAIRNAEAGDASA